MYSRTTDKARLGMRPSKKSIRRMVEKLHAMTALMVELADSGSDALLALRSVG